MHPFRRPGPLAGVIDAGQWLEGDLAIRVQLIEAAGHPEDRRYRRAAFVEAKDQRPLVAPELQVHQVEQNRLSGAGRPDDERMPDIALVEHEAEWRGSSGPGM